MSRPDDELYFDLDEFTPPFDSPDWQLLKLKNRVVRRSLEQEKRDQQNRRVIGLFIFLAVVTVAGFVVRYYR